MSSICQKIHSCELGYKIPKVKIYWDHSKIFLVKASPQGPYNTNTQKYYRFINTVYLNEYFESLRSEHELEKIKIIYKYNNDTYVYFSIPVYVKDDYWNNICWIRSLILDVLDGNINMKLFKNIITECYGVTRGKEYYSFDESKNIHIFKCRAVRIKFKIKDKSPKFYVCPICESS